MCIQFIKLSPVDVMMLSANILVVNCNENNSF